jgi:hypothetical protein
LNRLDGPGGEVKLLVGFVSPLFQLGKEVAVAFEEGERAHMESITAA